MTEPDKEKPKKKKKESIIKTEDSEGATSLAPPVDLERKASLTPERKGSSKSRKASTAEGVESEGKSRKASSAAEGEGQHKSRKASNTNEGSDAEPKPRKSSTAEGGEKESKSRKSSTAGETGEKKAKPRKSLALPEANEAAAVVDEDEDSDFEPPIMPQSPIRPDPNKTPFAAFEDAEKIDVNAPVKYFEAPPETTKNDLHLLKDLDNRRLAELMEAFVMFDFDGDGVINASDLRRTWASLDKPDIPDDEVQQMLAEGLNPLDFDAFVVLMGYRTLELDAEETLQGALSQWDYGTEGLISEERMRHDLTAFGDKFTQEEALAALEDAPLVVTKNKEKMIDYVKFANDLCGLRKRMKEYNKA